MKIDFNLYLITDRHQTRGRRLEDIINSAIDGGIRAIQLREKDLGVRDLLDLAGSIIKITRQSGVKLIINDGVDICLAVDADGVHLRSDSLPINVVRRILGRNKIIGVSTHSMEEAKRAEDEGADFITFGPIYRTPSKERYGDPLGLDLLEKACRKISIPVFAIGGIKTGNIDEVLARGVYGIAMILEIMGAEDVEKRTIELLGKIDRRGGIK